MCYTYVLYHKFIRHDKNYMYYHQSKKAIKIYHTLVVITIWIPITDFYFQFLYSCVYLSRVKFSCLILFSFLYSHVIFSPLLFFLCKINSYAIFTYNILFLRYILFLYFTLLQIQYLRVHVFIVRCRINNLNLIFYFIQLN